ncbi:TPA: hypothetical protein ACSPOR_004663 [Bacillus cereus]|uniref:hypothetical protein n=1 Tax=Bacillus cereus TaxID=1396 RepID=UPI00065BB779|nr:hypothetical protein [Bacillus cereus]KMQ22101.1 hypothetical protein TU58_30015 [Bacillus cereus]
MIQVDLQTLYQIESDGVLILQTPEFSEFFTVLNGSGAPIYGGEYGRLLENLKQTTAHIARDFIKDALLDRRVASWSENNPKDATPVLILSEAFKFAFRGTDKM